MDGSLPTNQELLEQKSQTAGSSGITGNGSLGGSLKPATSHNCRASDSGVHPAEGLSPVREKGVQMKSKSGCASRSDAGNMSTAYDLCTFAQTYGSEVKKSVGRMLKNCVGMLLQNV